MEHTLTSLCNSLYVLLQKKNKKTMKGLILTYQLVGCGRYPGVKIYCNMNIHFLK